MTKKIINRKNQIRLHANGLLVRAEACFDFESCDKEYYYKTSTPAIKAIIYMFGDYSVRTINAKSSMWESLFAWAILESEFENIS